MKDERMKDDFLLQVQRSCNPAEVSQPPAKRDGGNADRLPVLTLLPSRTLCSGARLWGRDLRASRSTLRQSRSPRSFPAGTSCLLSTRLPPTPDVVGRPPPSYFLGAATTARLRRCAQRTRARRAEATRALPEGPQSVLVSAERASLCGKMCKGCREGKEACFRHQPPLMALNTADILSASKQASKRTS